MEAVGLDSPRASGLAAAIADRRTPGRNSLTAGSKIDLYRARGLPCGPANRPFGSLDEISLVPDMSDDIAARLRPQLSLYNDSGTQAWHIIVTAVVKDRARFTRSAVVRMAADRGSDGSPLQTLTWE